MAHECSTPYIYHGYYIFPMTKMQYFMRSKDEYEYYRSGNEHFHLNDKYFWINPNTFLLESFTSIEDAKKACDLIIGIVLTADSFHRTLFYRLTGSPPGGSI